LGPLVVTREGKKKEITGQSGIDILGYQFCENPPVAGRKGCEGEKQHIDSFISASPEKGRKDDQREKEPQTPVIYLNLHRQKKGEKGN